MSSIRTNQIAHAESKIEMIRLNSCHMEVDSVCVLHFREDFFDIRKTVLDVHRIRTWGGGCMLHWHQLLQVCRLF